MNPVIFIILVFSFQLLTSAFSSYLRFYTYTLNQKTNTDIFLAWYALLLLHVCVLLSVFVFSYRFRSLFCIISSLLLTAIPMISLIFFNEGLIDAPNNKILCETLVILGFIATAVNLQVGILLICRYVYTFRYLAYSFVGLARSCDRLIAFYLGRVTDTRLLTDWMIIGSCLFVVGSVILFFGVKTYTTKRKSGSGGGAEVERLSKRHDMSDFDYLSRTDSIIEDKGESMNFYV